MIKAIAQGCKAGSIAGFVWGILILSFVSPMIQKAEVYEDAAAAFSSPQRPDQTAQHLKEGPHHHKSCSHHKMITPQKNDGLNSVNSHGTSQNATLSSTPIPPAEFQPNAWQRPILTVLGTLLLGIAFGILTSMSLALGSHYFSKTGMKPLLTSWTGSFLLGLIGFAIFQGIPALGLRPSLPGVIGAENDHWARQNWWLLSVCCSSVALVVGSLGWKLVKNEGRLAQSILFTAVIMTVAFPFLGHGVPEYSTASVTPLSLQLQFIWVSLIVSFAFWLLMSTSLTYFLRRQGRP